MDGTESLIEWWRRERDKIHAQLLEKSKTQPLSDVESMILNPFTLEQAKRQVQFLNDRLGGQDQLH